MKQLFSILTITILFGGWYLWDSPTVKAQAQITHVVVSIHTVTFDPNLSGKVVVRGQLYDPISRSFPIGIGIEFGSSDTQVINAMKARAIVMLADRGWATGLNNSDVMVFGGP